MAARAAGDPFAFPHDPRARERIRIGYLSADFYEHATAYLAAGLFEAHDRARFEVIAYSYGPDDRSAMRSRLESGFDRFVELASSSHRAAAEAIHADGIDILVDLKGYTQHARSEIMALRPAPIQVSFLGYPGTMGAPFIDYLIGDAFVTPVDHAADYDEQLVLLPGSYQVNDAARQVKAVPPRAELGLPGNGFVFCCFNQTYKILPEIFAVWTRLLANVSGSVLWLLEGNAFATRNLRRAAGDAGLDPGRLIFAPKLPQAQHLARIGAADLFLDTAPYNAHTTASDALWAGVPVVTWSGDTFASRVAGSLLNALRMPELAVESLSAYEELALRFSSDSNAMAAVRSKLACHRVSESLFDTRRFAAGIEAAFMQMWALRIAGKAPAMIVL
jgi:predicted O-linked N-acetylglucosamine transferase (SPINDLY family)